MIKFDALQSVFKGECSFMPWKRNIKFLFGFLLILLFIIPLNFTQVREYVSIPNHVTLFQHEASVSIPQLKNATVSEHPYIDNAKFHPREVGKSEFVYKYKNIPVKKVAVEVLKKHEVIPGGQSIGVQLHTLGVLVVGHHLVNQGEQAKSPAEHADIKVGDIILEMDGKKVKGLDDLKQIVQQAGKEKRAIDVKIKRGNEYIQTKVEPTYNEQDKTYQIGLYIRDSTTGIGTISFYDRVTGKYGALGHVISDADTKKPIEIHNGKIVRSTITHIEKGNRGIPGEKQARFSMKDEQLGTIVKNSPYGIFGKINTDLIEDHHDPIPIALAKDVKKGPAHILTVIEGDNVEKFDIEIINSIPQTFPSTKGMIIKVTDERLLEKTGGIVQGMSGSPIIQDGKLVGAVTHVFVNDPTSGYGVHIEWMLQEAGIDIFDDQEEQTYAKAL